MNAIAFDANVLANALFHVSVHLHATVTASFFISAMKKQAYLHDWIKARTEKQREDIVPGGAQPRGSSGVDSLATA